jgi:hypothetical protein
MHVQHRTTPEWLCCPLWASWRQVVAVWLPLGVYVLHLQTPYVRDWTMQRQAP